MTALLLLTSLNILKNILY